ncbi:mechanosensitive ion channel family protein [Pontimonas sp.]|jgi:small-conductance mechanosensitive channel|nr:mechanosensitive ion channel family protein [Pontimonas sp.]MDA8909686.1 mechanosensitive ion channel family protein [Pontimonas sp.]|tara:strand:- start:4936 stop:5868 length:933 start_codon:yes stop_codon:yes gene_type:complete
MDSWWDALAGTFEQYTLLFRILGVLLAGLIANIVTRFLMKRIVAEVVRGVKKTHKVDDTTELSSSPVAAMRSVQRARTLGSVLNNTATWIIASTVLILVLSELGFSVTALVASAGIIGAALGFGAQSVVKDVLNGLFMVFEDQLGVGDVVDLGMAEGVVERVGIRITEIRDVSGTLWFVRNGEILRVGNHTQDWSRVILDLPVPYESNIDEMQNVLLESAKSFAASPEWRRKVVEDPEVWGIQSLSAEAITLRLVVKVRAGEQWAAERALYRALKDSLDQRQVDIPPLNRMVVDNRDNPRTAKLRPPADD